MACQLTIAQCYHKLKSAKPKYPAKPSSDRGARGHYVEKVLGIPRSSDLTDVKDGELKTFKKGESIAVTSLNHCLKEIIEDKIPYAESKVGRKLKQVLYVAFTTSNSYLGCKIVNRESCPKHYLHLEEDYNFLCEKIRYLYNSGQRLSTVTGPNGLLQIRTGASKLPGGGYTPLTFNGKILKDKGMRFFLCGSFGKNLFNSRAAGECASAHDLPLKAAITSRT